MGKQLPEMPLPPVIPPPPPTAPVQPVGDTGTQTPTEVLLQQEKEAQAVVHSPDTEQTPQSTSGKVMPASVIDTPTAGRQAEIDAARGGGRSGTRATGPQGLLVEADVKKKGLLGT